METETSEPAAAELTSAASRAASGVQAGPEDLAPLAHVALGLATCGERAADEVLEAIDEALCLSRVGGGLLLATAAHGAEAARAARRTARILGVPIVGATVEGLVARGRECVARPALALMAWVRDPRKERIFPFLLDPVAGREDRVADEIAADLGFSPGRGDLIVGLPDALDVHLPDLLAGLDAAAADAGCVGVAAMGPADGPALSWFGEDVVEGGFAGLVIRGLGSPLVRVTDACRPLGEPMTVSRARGHWVYGLEGQPALDVFRARAGSVFDGDLPRAARSLLIAKAAAQGGRAPAELEHRHVTGFDEARGAFALPGPVCSGDSLQFGWIDSAHALADLRESLAGLPSAHAGLGLYFGCRGRGEVLFGHADFEASVVAQRVGGAPLLGAIGPVQLAGSPGSPTAMLTHAGVLALSRLG